MTPAEKNPVKVAIGPGRPGGKQTILPLKSAPFLSTLYDVALHVRMQVRAQAHARVRVRASVGVRAWEGVWVGVWACGRVACSV